MSGARVGKLLDAFEEFLDATVTWSVRNATERADYPDSPASVRCDTAKSILLREIVEALDERHGLTGGEG